MYRIYLIITLMILSIGYGSGCGTLGGAPKASVGPMKGKGPVADAMRDNRHYFETCALDSVSVQTGSTVKVLLRFKVNGEGDVVRVSVEKMKEPDPDLYECLVKAVKKIHFQPPYDGQTKEITYPLTLRPS